MASLKKLHRIFRNRGSYLALWVAFSLFWLFDRVYLKTGWSHGGAYLISVLALSVALMPVEDRNVRFIPARRTGIQMRDISLVNRSPGDRTGLVSGTFTATAGSVTAHEAEHPDRAAPTIRLDTDLGFPSWTSTVTGIVKQEDLVGPRPTIKKGRVVFETSPKKDLKIGGMDISDITALHAALIGALQTPDMRAARADAVRQQLERPGVARNVFARMEELHMQDRAIRQTQMAQMSQAMGGVFETDQQRHERNARIIAELQERLLSEQIATPVWESTTETRNADG